jgi:hypothetical protein
VVVFGCCLLLCGLIHCGYLGVCPVNDVEKLGDGFL